MVEYTLYHELLHVEMAMETLYDPHGQDFMNRMRAYDRRKELLEWARCKGITEEQLDTYL
jgi:hypothetical protein